MDTWFNRQLQNILLTILAENPIQPLLEDSLVALYLMDELPFTPKGPNGYRIKDEYSAIAKSLKLPLEITESVFENSDLYGGFEAYHFKYALNHSQDYHNEFRLWHNAIRCNLLYLEGHDLVCTRDGAPHNRGFIISSTGVDFLMQDGGLSAILGIVTVKIHSETIQQLIAAKIDAADLPPEDKSNLKSMLGTIKDSALSKITENAIDSVPAKMIVTFIREALKASIQP